jgi:hypothetical protein
MAEDPISEVAKATQEVAKTARTGIEAFQNVGGFLARVLGEPIETAVGIVSDRLRFTRAERLLRLEARYDEAVLRLRIDSASQPVPPKIALPIIESASLESDDELQDLWANLLASAHLPNVSVRSAFIDILRQLEVVDVHILAYVASTTAKRYPWGPTPLSGHEVMQGLRISQQDYQCAVDNLIRVRCVAPHVEDVKIVSDDSWYSNQVSRSFGYDLIIITPLGRHFLRACGLRTSDE